MKPLFKDRVEAGQKLAQELEGFRDEDPVILALPRGGLPVGYEIAKALAAPLDIILVRKIGAPGAAELAAGAIVDGDDPQIVLNDDVVGLYNISEDYIQQRAAQQLEQIERRRKLYRADHPPLDLAGKTVIVVDDGVATGSTVRAALKGVRKRRHKKLVLAVPVAPRDTLYRLRQEADEVVCLAVPETFWAISPHYEKFPQVSDEEVIAILTQAGDLYSRAADD